MNTEIVRPAESGDWEEWIARAEGFDVFHTHHHLSVIADSGEQPRLFVYGDNDRFVAYPFLKRRIEALDFLDSKDLETTYFDAITAEYAGPLIRAEDGDRAALLRDFRTAFESYCAEHDVVCEFGRLHPFINSTEPHIDAFDATTNKDIVYVDLQKDDEQIFEEMNKSKQKQVRSARADLRVEYSDDWRTFKEMYDATMARVDAKERYLYEAEFFEQLLATLQQEYCTLMLAYKDDQPVSGMIAVHGPNHIHSYLSCSYKDYLDLHGNVLLKYEVIEQGRETGREICNFGGGIEGSNTVFQFKKEFSKTTAPFYTYRHVHDQDALDRLNDLKRDAIGAERFEQIDFFPAYRGPQ